MPLTASQMRRIAELSATTRHTIGTSRVSVLRLCDLDLAVGTGRLQLNGKLYEAERVGQFWYLNGTYTTNP